jgi:hypothetical protein
MVVVDDVLADPVAYRAQALAGRFGTVIVGDVAFHGIQIATDMTVPAWIHTHDPALMPTLSFFRQSPAGQREPNYVHTDRDMGEWTAILYLNPTPAPGDGTTFWRHIATGATASLTRDDVALLDEQRAWRDLAQWEPAVRVEAKFGRLVIFPADRFHSRSIQENYGTGEAARLIQVVFGIGELREDARWRSQHQQR